MVPVRVCLDLNVFIAAFLSRQNGRTGTAAQFLVDAVRSGRAQLGPLQLVVSWGMLNRLAEILAEDLGVPRSVADEYVAAIVAYARLGPEEMSPVLALGGTGVIPLRDEEDRHVLETAVAGKARLLVTSNMRDFAFRDASVIEEGVVLEYNASGESLLIAVPQRSAEWLRQGEIIVSQAPRRPIDRK